MKHTKEPDHLSEKSTGMKIPHLNIDQIKENMTWEDALKLLQDLGEINDKEN